MSDSSRREFITAAGTAPLLAGGLMPAAGSGATSPGDAAVRAAFDAMVKSLATGDLDGFYGCMHERFLMLDEDSPWRLDKAGFQDHIGFHVGGVWDSFAWVPGDVNCRAFGRTGVAAGSAMFRGKPKDAGFRLRPLLFTQAWVQLPTGWRLLNWHQSPSVGHVLQASPA